MPIGCATHTYTITDRDGGTVTGSGLLTDVQYNRVLNDASTAQVVIGVSGPDCCAELGSVRSWRHTLNIYRNDDFMWSGQITNVDWGYDKVTVSATDIIGLLDRRVPHQDFVYTSTDLVDIAEDLIEDGLAPDDPGHTVTKVAQSGVTGGRSYNRNIGQTADHLRDLADTGMDFVAVGNNIVLLPDDFCEVVGRLSDEDLPEGVTVTEDGAALATRWIVAGSEASGSVGVAGGVHPYYGLLEQYVELTSITDQASADAAAAAKLKASLPVPTVIDTQNITLSPTANVDMLSLVPGWCLDITTSITCRDITQRLKITGLQVSEDGGTGDTPGQERILVQVVAAGGDETEDLVSI
jgi:hypothetical protein